MKKIQNGNIGIIIIAVILLITGIVFVKIFAKKSQAPTIIQSPVSVGETAKPQEQKLIYENKEIGFSVELPKEWEGKYSVEISPNEKDPNPKDGTKSISFILPTKDPNWLKQGMAKGGVFFISATPIEGLAKLKIECAKKDTFWANCLPLTNKIGENSKYVFTYLRADKITDYPSDFTPELFNKVDEIMKTFKVMNADSQDTTGWQTYRNDKYGFELQYPKFLKEENIDGEQKGTGEIVSLMYYDDQARDLAGNKIPGYYSYITVSYWKDINNDNAKGGNWAGEREYKNLEDFFTDDKAFITKIKETKIDNKKAFLVNIAGEMATEGIMIENGGIFRIEFPWLQHSPDDSIKEKIISTFKFIK